MVLPIAIDAVGLHEDPPLPERVANGNDRFPRDHDDRPLLDRGRPVGMAKDLFGQILDLRLDNPCAGFDMKLLLADPVQCVSQKRAEQASAYLNTRPKRALADHEKENIR